MASVCSPTQFQARVSCACFLSHIVFTIVWLLIPLTDKEKETEKLIKLFKVTHCYEGQKLNLGHCDCRVFFNLNIMFLLLSFILLLLIFVKVFDKLTVRDLSFFLYCSCEFGKDCWTDMSGDKNIFAVRMLL